MTTCRPNYVKWELQAQPAYLCAEESKSGELLISTDWAEDDEIPMEYWNRQKLRWVISPSLSNAELDGLIALAQPLILEFFETTAIEWNGSEWIRKLDRESAILDREIGSLCYSTTTRDFDQCSNPECEYCNQD